MPSGRKNRGSRHRSHKQHQKQELEESADHDLEANLRHGPLPDSDSSAWTMEPLPPRVEGPPVLKQDGENAESVLRGINRKIHQELQRGFQNATGGHFSSKRKKGTVAVSGEADASTNTPSSLDRWDGGDSRADETIALFDSVRGESQFYELTSSKAKVDNLRVVVNDIGWKEFKGDGDGKNRKGKGRAGLVSGNRAMTVIDVSRTGQSGASLGDTSIRIKNKVSRRRGFSEVVEDETDKSTPEVDSTPPENSEGQILGSNAIETVKANSQKGAAAKRWDKDVSRKEIDVEARLSHVFDTDSTVIESERKRGKTNDHGNSSPRSRRMDDFPKARKSEGSQKPRKSDDSAKVASRDDADALEEHRNAPSDAAKKKTGAEWILQDDCRNLELEKELENRIRRRREESGDRDRWRDDDKDRESRRYHYQKEEQHKDEGRNKDEKYKDEKHQDEKLKDDGLNIEKDRLDNQHRDEDHRELWRVEDKHKEEKQKADKNCEERCKDEKEHEEKHKFDRDREERSIDGKHKDDRHKDDMHKEEKEREDRQKEDKDARRKEDKLRESRYRVDKDKEGWHKDERIKSEDRSECHKEEKDWGDSFQDEKDKRGRQRDKDDKLKDKDKVERFDKLKEEKPKDDKERLDKHREEPDRDVVRDEKGKCDKKKSVKDQDDGNRMVKLQGARPKTEKQQDGRDNHVREHHDRQWDDGVGDGKQREDRVRDEKLQDYQDRDERYREDFHKFDKQDRSRSEREKCENAKGDKDKHELQRDDRDGRHHEDTVWDEKKKGNKDAADRLKDFGGNDDKQKEDYGSDKMLRDNRPADARNQDEKVKEEKQMEELMKPIERFDVRKEESKQSDRRKKDTQYSGMDQDYSSSHGGEPLIPTKDLNELVRLRGNHEQETRDRKSFVRLSGHEGDRRGLKVPWEDAQDQERSFSSFSSLVATDATKSEHRLKRSRDLGMIDSVIAQRDYARPRGQQCQGENDFSHEDKMLHHSQEERGSPYDALPKSPSPSFPEGSHTQSYEKSVPRTKFEASISVSSSSGTWRQRERNRHISEHSDQVKQHNGLEEEVKSWEPRVSNRDSNDLRGRSLSPERRRDSLSSLPLKGSLPPGHEEFSRGSIRGSVLYEDSVVRDREHRRFSQGGGPLKARRVDEIPRERSEWSHQGSQMNRPPMGGPMVRPQLAALPNRLAGPSGSLPPPPPFRPGIDNPTVLGAPSNAFEEGLGARESGRYDRKSGGSFKRSEMPGPSDTWRVNGMGNWNAQNQGPPGSMFSPFPQIGAHPPGVFLGMGQQFPGPPLFGPGGARPAADMGFSGARFHMGDGGVCFPGHGPSHGPMMSWHRPAETDETCVPPLPCLLDAWEGQGPYIDEQQRYGRPEWDQGAQGIIRRGWDRVPDLWQGQAGDARSGFNSLKFKREVSNQGSLGEEVSTFHQNSHKIAHKVQLVEDHLLDRQDTKDSYEVFPATPTDDRMGAVPLAEPMPSKQARARMQMLLVNANVSAKLANGDLYKQYLTLLPPSEAKVRELSAPNHRDASLEGMEDDFEFELDFDAQELLCTPDPYTELLPSLPDTAYKDALEMYRRPIRENQVQKSVYGSFLLPAHSSLIKMPSVDVELVDVRADTDAFGDQAHSPNEVVVDEDPFAVNNDNGMGPLSSTKDPRVEAEEREHVQDNEGLVPDPQTVEVDLFNEQVGGMVEDLITKGGESRSIMVEVEGMVTCVNEDAQEVPPLFVKFSMQSEFPLVEGSSDLGDLSKKRQSSDTTYMEERPPVLNLSKPPNIAEQVATEVDTAVLLAIGFETNGGTRLCGTDADPQALQSGMSIDLPLSSCDQSVDSHPAEQVEASQQIREDLEGQCAEDEVTSATHTFCSDGRAEESEKYLEETGEVEDDDVKGKSRPHESPEKAFENTH